MPKLTVGDKMPNFTFTTQDRENVSLHAAVKGKKKTVFWVLRYIGCPSCRYDVHMLSQRYQEFLDKDAQVFVVMQSTPESIRKSLADASVPFEIICDPTYEIYHGLDIGVWGEPGSKPDMSSADPAALEAFAKLRAEIQALGFAHGEYEGIEEQLPALFITDSDATVTYALYPDNVKVRMPSVDQALELL